MDILIFLAIALAYFFCWGAFLLSKWQKKRKEKKLDMELKKYDEPIDKLMEETNYLPEKDSCDISDVDFEMFPHERKPLDAKNLAFIIGALALGAGFILWHKKNTKK